MKGPQPRDVRPYKTMVPTLSTKYEDYESLRDLTPCFPDSLRHPIPVETTAGKQSANRALTTLHINSDIGVLHFVTLWRCYEKAVKMAKLKSSTDA